MINNFYIKMLIRSLKENKIYNDLLKKLIYKQYIKCDDVKSLPQPHLLLYKIYPTTRDGEVEKCFTNLIIDKYIENIIFSLKKCGVDYVINDNMLKKYIMKKELSKLFKYFYNDEIFYKYNDFSKYVFYGN